MQLQTEVRHHPTVYFIDDDKDLRDSLSWLIESGGYRYESFEHPQDFLDISRLVRPGCLLLDVCIPNISGIDVFEELNRREMTIPVIFITGFADVTSAVTLMKRGAIDYIEKPCDRRSLLRRIQQAIDLDDQTVWEETERLDVETRMAQLSVGELEVMDRIVAGESNKKMAADLSITERAIEYRRSSLMKKLGAESVVDIARVAFTCQRDSRKLQSSEAETPQPHLNKWRRFHGRETLGSAGLPRLHVEERSVSPRDLNANDR